MAVMIRQFLALPPDNTGSAHAKDPWNLLIHATEGTYKIIGTASSWFGPDWGINASLTSPTNATVLFGGRLPLREDPIHLEWEDVPDHVTVRIWIVEDGGNDSAEPQKVVPLSVPYSTTLPSNSIIEITAEWERSGRKDRDEYGTAVYRFVTAS